MPIAIARSIIRRVFSEENTRSKRFGMVKLAKRAIAKILPERVLPLPTQTHQGVGLAVRHTVTVLVRHTYITICLSVWQSTTASQPPGCTHGAPLQVLMKISLLLLALFKRKEKAHDLAASSR